MVEKNEKDEKDTFIKDSKVEIIINSGPPPSGGKTNKKTDYLSLAIILVIMLAAATYVFLIRFRPELLYRSHGF